MEGKGPGSGTPRAMDSLFAARDATPSTRRSPTARPTSATTSTCWPPPQRRGLIDLDDPYELDRRPDRARPRLRASRRWDADASLRPARGEPCRTKPAHRPSAARRRGGLHALRRLRRDLRRRGDHALAPRRSTTTTAACAASPAPRSARRRPSARSARRWRESPAPCAGTDGARRLGSPPLTRHPGGPAATPNKLTARHRAHDAAPSVSVSAYCATAATRRPPRGLAGVQHLKQEDPSEQERYDARCTDERSPTHHRSSCPCVTPLMARLLLPLLSTERHGAAKRDLTPRE